MLAASVLATACRPASRQSHVSGCRLPHNLANNPPPPSMRAPTPTAARRHCATLHAPLQALAAPGIANAPLRASETTSPAQCRRTTTFPPAQREILPTIHFAATRRMSLARPLVPSPSLGYKSPYNSHNLLHPHSLNLSITSFLLPLRPFSPISLPPPFFSGEPEQQFATTFSPFTSQPRHHHCLNTPKPFPQPFCPYPRCHLTGIVLHHSAINGSRS